MSLHKQCTSLTQPELSSVCLMALCRAPVELTGKLRGAPVKVKIRRNNGDDVVCNCLSDSDVGSLLL